MPSREPFDVRYDETVLGHLRSIDRRHHASIRQAIESNLRDEPTKVSRNRKLLRRLTRWPEAWELRCGRRNEFRVFYRVDPATRTVMVLAVGVKDRSVLRIGGEEFER